MTFLTAPGGVECVGKFEKHCNRKSIMRNNHFSGGELWKYGLHDNTFQYELK
jgi:hypothetical protein